MTIKVQWSLEVVRSPLSRLTKLQRWLPLLLLLEFLHRAPFVSLIRLGIMLYSCEMLQLFSPPGDRLHFHGRGGQSGSTPESLSNIPGCSRNLALKSRADAGLREGGREAFILSGERTMSQVKYCSTTDGRAAHRLLQREGAMRLVPPSDGCPVGRGRSVGRPMTDSPSARGSRSDVERALIAVVNDSVFVEEIYSGRAGFPARSPACLPDVMGRRGPHWM